MEGSRTHQLKDLFAIANLPYSKEMEALSELKNVLFLLLRSSDSSHIEHKGVNYSRNDILIILDGVKYSHDSPLFRFLEDFPSILPILHPQSIKRPLDFEELQRLKGTEWEELQYQLDDDYFMSFLADSYKQISKLEIAGLQYRMTFLTLFQSYLEVKYLQKVSNSLTNRLKVLAPPESINFIYHNSYRKIVQRLSDCDSLFFTDQYHALILYLEHLSYEDGCIFFELQLTLAGTHINRTQVKYDYYSYQKKHSDSNDTSEFKAIKEMTIAEMGLNESDQWAKKLRAKLWRTIGIPTLIIVIFIFAINVLDNPSSSHQDGIKELKELERIRKEIMGNRPIKKPFRIPASPSDSITNIAEPISPGASKAPLPPNSH